jgi:hypothetical protein
VIGTLPKANMLWIGAGLGPLERACMRSVIAQGHRLDLWHFAPLAGVPEGVTLRDAAEIVPRERIFRHVPSGSYALFSNLFRYSLLQAGEGLWLDSDMYLLKPITAESGHVFGWQQPGLISAGVLLLPSGSPVLSELIEHFAGRRIPPWLPLRWRLRYAWQRARRGAYRIETMPWGNLGPRGLTRMLQLHGLIGHALPQSAFSPTGWRDAGWIFESGARLEDRVTPQTLAIHLYNELVRARKDAPPPPDSFLERIHREGA